ncbi:hypothetical protein [Dehalogenimonas alkenigignens]|uniref:Uncharacterized protein n=1 Tax=Dehalogenimonas alkenigignens TaxID=1217799 RepID=A0A0W0GGH6_9CHLR|nr:hypothetical protein [Dehalogenimonas alkenigignens]KTB47649.1 hypothetical protein DEALK_04940 [Dehalogenimonas alkenigignens]
MVVGGGVVGGLVLAGGGVDTGGAVVVAGGGVVVGGRVVVAGGRVVVGVGGEKVAVGSGFKATLTLNTRLMTAAPIIGEVTNRLLIKVLSAMATSPF